MAVKAGYTAVNDDTSVQQVKHYLAKVCFHSARSDKLYSTYAV